MNRTKFITEFRFISLCQRGSPQRAYGVNNMVVIVVVVVLVVIPVMLIVIQLVMKVLVIVVMVLVIMWE